MEEEDVFRQVGFTSNPFNPMGVTRGIDEQVPPPVGVRQQLTTAIKRLRESVSYYDNMALAIIGDYGSGKSELMKYLYRYIKNKNIDCVFTQFQKKALNLYLFLKHVSKSQKAVGGKSARLVVFIDEIDDIPRMIKDNIITKNEADRFIKDLRRFLERNDDFKIFKSIMLVLGFGTESWTYIKRYHPDLSDSRLVGFKIKLGSPEEWKMAGLVRRYIYFYANEELKEHINRTDPYYPFTEGIAVALAKLSALAHQHSYVNTRMLIKLLDRILFYLARRTIEKNEKIIIQFSIDDFKQIIEDPSIIGLNEPHFEDAIIQIRDSLKEVSIELAKQVNLESDIIYNFLFRIYFDHSNLSEEEMKKIVGNRMSSILKQKLLEAGVIEEVYIISYDNPEPKYNKIVRDIECKTDKDKPKFIEILKQYATFTDNDLERKNYDPSSVPLKEYLANLVVKVNDIEKLEEDLKDLFKRYGRKYLRVSKKRWEKEIRDKQIRAIEASGEIKAFQKFERENPTKLMVEFTKNFKKIMKDANISFLKTNDSYINDIVCALDAPRNAIVFIKGTESTDLMTTLRNYLHYCKKSNETFEAITFLVPEDTETITIINSATNILNNDLKNEYFERDIPVFHVFSFPKRYAVHIIYFEETKSEECHKEIIRDVVNWIRELQIDEIRNRLQKENRIPLDSRDFKKTDFNILYNKSKELWEAILEGDKSKIQSYYNDIKEKFGEMFTFDDKQKFSLIERDLIEIISQLPLKITNKNADSKIKKRFALSCSVLKPADILSLLEIKGILLNKKPTAVKNYEFERYSTDSVEREEWKDIEERYIKLKEKLQNLQSQRIEFLDNFYPISIDIPYIDAMKLIEDDIYELDKKIKNIDELIPVNFKFITGDTLIAINSERATFQERKKKIEKKLANYENFADDLEETTSKLKLMLREIESFYSQSERQAQEIIVNEIKDIPIKLQKIKNENDLKKLVEDLNLIKLRLKEVISVQKELDLHYEALKSDIEDINYYLSILEQLNNLKEDLWYSVFGLKTNITQIINSLKQMNPQVLEPDYILAELPHDLDEASKYLKWFKKETENISNFGEKIILTVYEETIAVIEPLYRFYSWILYRKEDSLLKQKVIDQAHKVKQLYQRIKSQREIGKEEIEQLFKVKELFDEYLEEEFGEYKEIVFLIGRNGEQRAINTDNLIERFGESKVMKCINKLIEKGLIIQSYTT